MFLIKVFFQKSSKIQRFCFDCLIEYVCWKFDLNSTGKEGKESTVT